MNEIDWNPLMILGGALTGIGLVLAVFFYFTLLVKAFQTGIFWGLGCLFLAFPVFLVFVISSWNDNGNAFLRHLGGAVLAGVGFALMTAQAWVGPDPAPEENPSPPPAMESRTPAPAP